MADMAMFADVALVGLWDEALSAVEVQKLTGAGCTFEAGTGTKPVKERNPKRKTLHNQKPKQTC
jgi:hypothetical protein